MKTGSFGLTNSWFQRQAGGREQAGVRALRCQAPILPTLPTRTLSPAPLYSEYVPPHHGAGLLWPRALGPTGVVAQPGHSDLCVEVPSLPHGP